MSRGLAALVAAVLLLGSASPAAGAQAGGGGERGPGALWDAYPLQERPRTTEADDERSAAAPASARPERVAFRRQEPTGSSPLMLAALLCVGAGLLLSAVGFVRGRRSTGPAGRGRAGL